LKKITLWNSIRVLLITCAITRFLQLNKKAQFTAI
jgi:hypothetical protein